MTWIHYEGFSIIWRGIHLGCFINRFDSVITANFNGRIPQHKKRTKTSLPYYCIVSGVLHCRAQVMITAYLWETFALVEACASSDISRDWEASSHVTVFVTKSVYCFKPLRNSQGFRLAFDRCTWFQAPPLVGHNDSGAKGQWLKFKVFTFQRKGCLVSQ